MKKLSIISFIILCSLNSKAQITVNTLNNVGVGTSAPATMLDVNGPINISSGAISYSTPPQTSSNTLSYGLFPHSNVGIGLYSFAGGISFWGGATPAEYMRIMNGNVSIGTTSTPEVLTINGNIRGNVGGGALQINTSNIVAGTYNTNAYVQIGPQNGGYCHMYTNTNVFAFNQSICTTTGYIGSYYSGSLYLSAGITSANPKGTVGIAVWQNGYVSIGPGIPIGGGISYLLDLGTSTNSTIRASNIVYNSDSTLKTNIQNLTGSTATLLLLQGKSYKFKPNATTSNLSTKTLNTTSLSDTSKINPINNFNDTINTNRIHYGFLAQDIQKIYPDLVYTDKQGVMGIDYTGFIAILAQSIKEQNTVITNLQSTNTKLQNSVTTIQTNITNLQTSNASLQATNANLQTTNASIQAAITALQASVAALQKKVNAL